MALRSVTGIQNKWLMSFSGEVKEELVKLGTGARHCQIAELAVLLIYSGAVRTDGGSAMIELHPDVPLPVEKRSLVLLGQLFKTENRVSRQKVGVPETDLGNDIDVTKVLQAIKYAKGDILVNPMVMKSLCCKRAYLRGAFLAIGSISNPEKGYHLEFVCEDMAQAGQLVDTLLAFEIQAKIVARKRYQVVYIKESEEIVELLNVIGAHVSLMNLENLRILKDMRNSVNRRVNCEAANITKTVNAAAKQIDDIQYIKEHYGFDNLPDNLRQMAQLRLEYPDATLKELGERLMPPVGKSGVNHRLRKLSELAKNIKGKRDL